MKKNMFGIIAFVTIAASVAAFAAGPIKPGQFQREMQTVKPYCSIDELPDAVKFMPPPPSWSSSLFIGDHASYVWGKSLRGTPRGAAAVEQAAFLFDDILPYFAKPFGMDISKEKTPAIYNVLQRGVITARLATSKPKQTYMRTRPFARYDEPTPVPEDEAELRKNGAYPSGHSARGWSMALLMTEINPAAQDELLKLGYEWGESRVIIGYHWRSDVEAGRQCAAAACARMHADEDFLADMAAARAEFVRLKR